MDETKIIQLYNEGLIPVITVVKDMSTRIDSLIGTVTSLNNEINGLNNEIVDLKASSANQALRIADLEARLNKNSGNSSKPPSSDGYQKSIQNNRQKSGKATGGQAGHEGRTLAKVANPDKSIEHKIPETCDCGCNLNDVPSIKKTRQVFDIPKPRIQVTEYVTHEAVCPGCGKVHKTEFPTGVNQPTQYGENMQGLMNYLTQYQLIPLERAAEAIRDITGQSVSEGTLVNVAKSLYRKLENPVEAIKQQIIASNMAHFDETGMRSEGETKWLHVAATSTLTYLQVHDNRGEKAAQAIGILPNFEGTAMHDHWKPYYCFTTCQHAECNAHNLRYLKDVIVNYKQDWAHEMAGLLSDLKRRVESLKLNGFSEMPREEIQIWHGRYHNTIAQGIKEDAEKSPVVLNKKGKPKKSKPLQLLLKLQQYDIETLAFMYDFSIPFDNNLAERSIRMQKLRQKISGCFRGGDGANVFTRIRSYLSTARKNGIDAMDAIAMAIKEKPFIPEV